jgi:hypothetical protein
MWLGAVFGQNFPSPSAGSGTTGFPLGGVIFALPRGAGRVIVSGVALDLAEVRKTPGWPRSWANCSLL